MHCSVVTDTRLDDLLRSDINLSDYRAAYEKSFSLRIVGGGDPLYMKFRVNRPPSEQNSRF